jgi:hypothetical protein
LKYPAAPRQQVFGLKSAASPVILVVLPRWAPAPLPAGFVAPQSKLPTCSFGAPCLRANSLGARRDMVFQQAAKHHRQRPLIIGFGGRESVTLDDCRRESWFTPGGNYIRQESVRQSGDRADPVSRVSRGAGKHGAPVDDLPPSNIHRRQCGAFLHLFEGLGLGCGPLLIRRMAQHQAGQIFGDLPHAFCHLRPVRSPVAEHPLLRATLPLGGLVQIAVESTGDNEHVGGSVEFLIRHPAIHRGRADHHGVTRHRRRPAETTVAGGIRGLEVSRLRPARAVTIKNVDCARVEPVASVSRKGIQAVTLIPVDASRRTVLPGSANHQGVPTKRHACTPAATSKLIIEAGIRRLQIGLESDCRLIFSASEDRSKTQPNHQQSRPFHSIPKPVLPSHAVNIDRKPLIVASEVARWGHPKTDMVPQGRACKPPHQPSGWALGFGH